MATGDILSMTVNTDGFSAYVVIEGFTTGAGYDFGLGTNNASLGTAKVVFTVVSEGYNSAGTLGTVTRTVYGTSTCRKAYPAEASGSTGPGTTVDEVAGGGNMTVRISLSHQIYLDDNTGAGKSGTAPTVSISAGWCVNTGGASQSSNAVTGLTVTNSSTLVYPKVIGQWDGIAGSRTADRVKADFTLAANAYHAYGIAAVKFTATGQTSGASVNSTVTAQTATARSATTLYASAYQATLAISGFTQAELINADFIAYPVVGDASSLLDTSGSTTGTNEPLGYNRAVLLCDKSNALDDAVYVSPSGNDTTGTGTSGNPYATIAKGMKEGNIVYLTAGTHAAVGSAQTRKASSEWVIAQPAPGESSATVTVQLTTTLNYRCERMMYSGVTVSILSATSYLSGENADNYLRFKNCVFAHGGVTATTAGFPYRSNCTYVENCTGNLNVENWRLRPLSTNRFAAQFDGCEFAETNTSANACQIAYRLVACNSDGAFRVGESSTSNPAPSIDNLIIAFNRMRDFDSTSSNMVIYGSSVGFTIGAAFVGNVLEKNAGTSAAVFLGGDGSTVNMEHVLFWNNTVAGERANMGYNDQGSSAPTRTNWSMKFNAMRDWNNKDDTFPTANAARINSWPVGFGCNFQGDRFELANFPGEYPGTNFELMGDDGIGYVDNASFTGDGTGNGDYTPTMGSVLRNLIPAGQAVLPYDLFGVQFGNTGNGSGGAIQYAGDLFNPGTQVNFGFFF